MLNYAKITFNELDDADKPFQAFYNYDLKGSEINDFLEEYATIEEIPENVSIQKIELCLTIYARHDFKLEACCTDTENNQYWIEIITQFFNADEFINLIPNYKKLFNENTWLFKMNMVYLNHKEQKTKYNKEKENRKNENGIKKHYSSKL